MKKFIFGKIGSSVFTVHYIEQFDDVKINSSETGDPKYTLPDGTIPDDIESWQARPDPECPEGYTPLLKERPLEGSYIVSNEGTWVEGEEIDVELNESIKKDLLTKAQQQIIILQYAVDSDQATDLEKILLKKWLEYSLQLNRINVNSIIVWPEPPTI